MRFRASSALLALWPLIAMTAAAQSASDEGVRAALNGDYRRAVEILKPLAEDWRTDDTAAQFYMAGLYEKGLGIAADPLRACALYARALNSNSPLGREALRLLGEWVARDPQFTEDCLTLANTGFDNGFERASFELAPGHLVDWSLSSIVMTYEGRTKREPMGSGTRGARFLPVLYTKLATGRDGSQIRHFFEVFAWQPWTRSGPPWKLQWQLVEVVRDEIIRIDSSDSIVTIDSEAPPSREKFDVRNYVVLRLDVDGNPEWATLQGPRARSERIESDIERREIREERLAAEAALKRVDWSKRYDVVREPTLSYIDGDGCGHALVYGWTADRAEAIVVSALGSALGLSTTPATFDLSRETANITVEAHVFDSPVRQFDFCSDVHIPRSPEATGPEIWHAVAGTITIELSPPGIRARAPHLRRATVTLSNLVLRNASGSTVTMRRSVTLQAMVGGVAG